MFKRFAMLLALFLVYSLSLAQDTGLTATAYGTVNVRSGPGARYEIVGQIGAGEQVDVTGRDSDTSGWLHVMLEDGIVGWIASFAVLLDGDPTDLPIMVLNELPSSGDGSPTITAYGRVNVRGGPGMEYEIVGQLDVNDTATISGRSNDENDWLFIENDDLTGWVAYFTVSIQGNLTDLPVLVVPGSGQGVALPDEVVMARYNVRLRSLPDFTSDVLQIVPFRTNVTPLARSADSLWVYVEYLEVRGWGAASLFDFQSGQLDALPVFNRNITLTVSPTLTPTPEGTPNPDEEA